MTTLITPSQVLRLAFGPGEYLTPESVATADIQAAEERYLVPVIGRRLHARLLAGDGADFARDYLWAAVALFTRALVQPRLDVRTGRCGTTAPRTSSAQPADEQACRRLQRALRTQGRTLLRRAAARLETLRDEFPEYDPRENIFNRCATDGGFVQIR